MTACGRKNVPRSSPTSSAGDPSPAATPELVAALERGGADLIELGVPFSDPIADGPVIQRGSDRALKAGTKLSTVLDIASQIRKQSEIPLLLFTYMNPVLRYGLEPLARAAVASGIDGCLLTDLSVEEAEPYIHVMRQAGLDTVFLAAPTSSQRRLELVAKYSTGFVYLVSRTGVTGERTNVSDSVGPLVAAMRARHARFRWRLDSASRPPTMCAPLARSPMAWWWAARSSGSSKRTPPAPSFPPRWRLWPASLPVVYYRRTNEHRTRAGADCRRQIDAVDVKIVELLNERTEIVHEIGRIKRQFALPIYEPKREDQVFENVTTHNPGPLTAEALKRIFERIIDEMRTIQQKKMS